MQTTLAPRPTLYVCTYLLADVCRVEYSTYGVRSCNMCERSVGRDQVASKYSRVCIYHSWLDGARD